MRVLIVHNNYQHPGGEDVVFATETAALEKAGATVTQLRISNDLIAGSISKVMAAVQTPYSISGKKIMTDAIRRYKPDIVHVHNFFPLLSPAVFDACWKLKVPAVLTLHNYRTICAGGSLSREGKICHDCIGRAPWAAIEHGCYRGSMIASATVAAMIAVHHAAGTWQKKVQRFIALNQFGKGIFIEAGFPADKIVVKPNFIDDPGVGAPYHNRDGAVFVGRVSREKGIEALLAAWKFVDAPLTIIGDGPEFQYAKAVAAEHSNIRILGRMARSDVLAEIKKAKVLIVPSVTYESFGMVVIEAFACGTPVIATKMGGMEELVVNGYNGVLVKPSDVRGLAEASRHLTANGIQNLAMAENARLSYLKNYSSNKCANLLLEIYKAAINEFNADR